MASVHSSPSSTLEVSQSRAAWSHLARSSRRDESSLLFSLPEELRARILDLLDGVSLGNLACTCAAMRHEILSSEESDASDRWHSLCLARLGLSVCALHRAFAAHQHAQEASAEEQRTENGACTQLAVDPGDPWRLGGGTPSPPHTRSDRRVSCAGSRQGSLGTSAGEGERRPQRWLLDGGDGRVQAWFWHRVFGASVKAVELQWWPNGGEIFRQSLIAARRSKQAEGGAEIVTAPLLPMAAPPVAGVCPYDETAVSALESLERTGHTATEVGTWQVIIGGLMRSGQAVMDVVLVCTATMAMHHPPAHVFADDCPPLPRFRHTAVPVRVADAFREGFAGPADPVLFVFGGYSLQGGVYGAEESFFLAITNAGRRVVWRRAAAAGVPPSPRFHHAMCAFDQGRHVIVYGGEGTQVNDWADEADEQVRGLDVAEGDAVGAPRVWRERARGVRLAGDGAQVQSLRPAGTLSDEMFERQRLTNALSADQSAEHSAEPDLACTADWRMGGSNRGAAVDVGASARVSSAGASARVSSAGASEGPLVNARRTSSGATCTNAERSYSCSSCACYHSSSTTTGSSGASSSSSSSSASRGGESSACRCSSADECEQHLRASTSCPARAASVDSAVCAADSGGKRRHQADGAVARWRRAWGGWGSQGGDEGAGGEGREEGNEQGERMAVEGWREEEREMGSESELERAVVVYVLDVQRMVWQRVATRGRGPGVRFLHYACMQWEGERGRERMVVFGGYKEKHEEMEDMRPFTLHLASMTWRAPPALPPSHAPHLPLPRNRSGITKVGPEQVLLVEGTTYGTRDYLSDMHLLNLNTLRWSPVRVHGAGMAGPSAGHSVEGLLVVGGCVLGTLGIHPISRVDPLLLGNFGSLPPPPAAPGVPSAMLAFATNQLALGDAAAGVVTSGGGGGGAVVASRGCDEECGSGGGGGPLDLILRVRDVRNNLVQRSDWADAGNDDYPTPGL